MGDIKQPEGFHCFVIPLVFTEDDGQFNPLMQQYKPSDMLIKTFIVFFFFISCSTPGMIETDLYFGQSKPNGSMITEAEWNHFRETQLSRIFKEGSTTTSVMGNWYDPADRKLISEPTYMVSYYHRKSRSVSRQIDSLRNLYKSLFQQQSVLRVDKKIQVSF